MTSPRQVWICEETGRTYRTAQAARSAGYRHRKKLNALAQILDKCDYIRNNATGVENMMNLFVDKSEEFWGVRMWNLSWNIDPMITERTVIKVSTVYAIVDEKKIKQILKVQGASEYPMWGLRGKARTEFLMLCFLRRSVSGVNIRQHRFRDNTTVEFTFEIDLLSNFPGLLAERDLWLCNKAAMYEHNSNLGMFMHDVSKFVSYLPDIEKIGNIIEKFEEALAGLRQERDDRFQIYLRNFKERWLRDNPAPIDSGTPNLDDLSGHIPNV